MGGRAALCLCGSSGDAADPVHGKAVTVGVWEDPDAAGGCRDPRHARGQGARQAFNTKTRWKIGYDTLVLLGLHGTGHVEENPGRRQEVKTAPKQLQAAMASVIEAAHLQKKNRIGTADAYDAYKKFCKKAGV